MSLEQKFYQWILNFPNDVKSENCNAILNLFSNVKEITGQSSEEVLEGVDFTEADKRLEKLEAVLAELRAVMFLKNYSFTGISLLPGDASLKTRRPDILAQKDGVSFAIEVKCLTAAHSREKIPGLNIYRLDDDKFLTTLKSYTEKAKTQLDSIKSDKKMMVFVLNRAPDLQLHKKEEYQKIIQCLIGQLNWGQEYYLGFLTGMEGEDFILPGV